MLIAYYLMWHAGHSAPGQCEGSTWVTSQVRELSCIHSRDVNCATSCQGPYEESARYRDFMGQRCLGARLTARSTPSWSDAGGHDAHRLPHGELAVRRGGFREDQSAPVSLLPDLCVAA